MVSFCFGNISFKNKLLEHFIAGTAPNLISFAAP